MADNRTQTQQSPCHAIRIDVLPDDVLLGVFDFYVDMSKGPELKPRIEAWKSLVHVCRRWRILVFGSPRRLNLRLVCTPEARVSDALDVWPALPLVVWGMVTSSGTDNVIAALGQSNRVCQINLWNLASLADWEFKKILVAMQAPFPELTGLRLISNGVVTTPDPFLDERSTSRLRYFRLDGIPFPGLPKMLSSATHLVNLRLSDIPHSGYVPPEALATLLCALPSLKSLFLEFRFPPSRSGSQPPPPSKHFILPALDRIRFEGVPEYLEDLVTFIDAPQLTRQSIIFFNQIHFNTTRLAQFISRAPKLQNWEAYLRFDDTSAFVRLISGARNVSIKILCEEPNLQLSSIAQVCNSSLHPLSAVEDLRLCIEEECWELDLERNLIENTLWLPFFRPFTAVKNIYLPRELAPGIAAALRDLVGARVTVVLPSLQNIFVESSLPEPSRYFDRYAAARRQSGHPIAVSVWN